MAELKAICPGIAQYNFILLEGHDTGRKLSETE
jgi:hypothetical protein